MIKLEMNKIKNKGKIKVAGKEELVAEEMLITIFELFLKQFKTPEIAQEFINKMYEFSKELVGAKDGKKGKK